MDPILEEYNCIEYLDDYYMFGLFHATECQEIYSHENMVIDKEKQFLRIGEIYDDQDLIFGYRKNIIGIWGHYNRHFDGTFQFIADSLKGFCEGWFQRNRAYWNEMDSEKQWLEMSRFFKLNIEKYDWRGEKIKAFIDNCLRSKQLTVFYVKAHGTLIEITKVNGFYCRSFTNMVNMYYEYAKDVYVVHFKSDFFDYNPKVKEYPADGMDEAINDINEWIKSSALIS